MKRRRDFFEKTYSIPRYRVVLHCLFWLAMFSSYYYFNTISFNPTRETPAAWLLAVNNTVVLALAFYSLMYLIWPLLFAKRRWWAGIAALTVWIFILAILLSVGDVLVFSKCAVCLAQLAQYSPDYFAFLQRDLPDIVFMRVLSGGFLYQMVLQLSLPVAVKIGRSYFRQTVQQLQLAKDNLQLEFNFLKSQVNPHFLFNTLNNIYSLVVAERNEQAAATISRLSGFMRYALYETGDEKILLEKEVQLLKDYVALEKLRLNETEVVFTFDSDNSAYTIPPLLFIPALENAFKYTTDKKGSRISVNIRGVNNRLQVSIENSWEEQPKKTGGGIGLQNLQRRLQHYYGADGSWSVTAANGVYLFRLTCTLA